MDLSVCMEPSEVACRGKQGRYEILRPKRTSLRRRVPEADATALAFLRALLTVDPALRPTAEQALAHPWLTCAPATWLKGYIRISSLPLAA